MSVIFAPPSNFNPRSREGSDGGKYDETKDMDQFQSTLP